MKKPRTTTRAILKGLDVLVEEAVGARYELNLAESNRKLTARAMLSEALELAGCNEQRLDDLRKKIAETPGMDNTSAFLRRLVNFIKEPTCPRAPQDISKTVRILGGGDCESQLAQIRSTSAEAVGLAVVICSEKHASSFGPVEDWNHHQSEIATLRERLEKLYQNMRDGYSAADLTIDMETVTTAERDRGLARVCFKRSPGVTLVGDWPERLVTAATRQGNGKRKAA